MLFARSALFLLGSQLTLIFVVCLLLIGFYLPHKYRYKIGSLWGKFNIWWLGTTCQTKFNIIGKENIPNKPCVVASNHQSTWETFAFQILLPQQTWVLKKELLWIPIFGQGLALLKPIVIDRGDKFKALKKVIMQGAQRIQSGIFVIIFPEGTRQPYGQLGDYQKGAIAIAKKAQCDILPMYHNAGKFWPKRGFIKYPGMITIVIGSPIKSEKKSADTLITQIREWTELQAKNYID